MHPPTEVTEFTSSFPGLAMGNGAWLSWSDSPVVPVDLHSQCQYRYRPAV